MSLAFFALKIIGNASRIVPIWKIFLWGSFKMKKGIWNQIFDDILFEGGKVPTREERKKMYDACYRKVRRQFKKEGRKPSKEEMDEEIEDCLRHKLYMFQLDREEIKKNVDTAFETGKINRRREDEEIMKDARILNRMNRNFFSQDDEDQEESRKRKNKKLKDEIEERIRRESGYY